MPEKIGGGRKALFFSFSKPRAARREAAGQITKVQLGLDGSWSPTPKQVKSRNEDFKSQWTESEPSAIPEPECLLAQLASL